MPSTASSMHLADETALKEERRRQNMKTLLNTLLPAKADNTIRGMKLPVYVFSVIAIISTVRSLIHLLTPDSGAGSIAGIDFARAGKSGTIFGFGLWGSAQLIYALIQLAVVSRYRSLVPFMYVLLILETLLRVFVGHAKPVPFVHTAPGKAGNAFFLPLSVFMLALSLWSARRQVEKGA
jgi:hypothetical protein